MGRVFGERLLETSEITDPPGVVDCMARGHDGRDVMASIWNEYLREAPMTNFTCLGVESVQVAAMEMANSRLSGAERRPILYICGCTSFPQRLDEARVVR